MFFFFSECHHRKSFISTKCSVTSLQRSFIHCIFTLNVKKTECIVQASCTLRVDSHINCGGVKRRCPLGSDQSSEGCGGHGDGWTTRDASVSRSAEPDLTRKRTRGERKLNFMSIFDQRKFL